MQELLVDPSFGAKLGQLAGQTVLCDAEGRILGFFSPLRDRPLVKDLQLESPLSIAQTEELRKNRTGKPLEEILARLRIQ